jgi:heme O synthase-like polyprenyltransferase
MTAVRWLAAAVRTTRPRQWPKNLVVFAAPLAGATVGRHDGLGYAVLAAVVFGCASAAVYLVNDVVDAERDRRHPVKRRRPVASGALMLAMYLLRASGETDGARVWHMVSTLALALALCRFGALTGQRTVRPVEEMITGDGPMIACEVAWLGLFCAGLAA